MVVWLQRSFSLLFMALLVLPPASAQERVAIDPHISVSMRMVGHAVLLKAGDTTSLVLPIEREADTYRISFAAEFGLVPEVLAATVDSVMDVTKVADNYVVEVLHCGTDQVIYSYERGLADTLDIMPCLSRALPNTCYALRISLLNTKEQGEQLAGVSFVGPTTMNGRTGWILGGGLFILGALVAFMFLRRKNASALTINADAVPIGAFHFHKGKMELTIQDRKVELSGKEADLLHLLHGNANETVAREVMLKEVWGNESDYVGRTLDVFISKLRKKLEDDPSVRIANIRGVGYRLILDT